jgi:hypothetical protein
MIIGKKMKLCAGGTGGAGGAGAGPARVLHTMSGHWGVIRQAKKKRKKWA